MRQIDARWPGNPVSYHWDISGPGREILPSRPAQGFSEREFVSGHPKVSHSGQEDETRESILRERVFGVAQQFPQRAYHRANRNHDDSERNENDGRGGIGMLRRKPSQEDDGRIFAEAQRHI
jgi:hypothetical protein